MDDGRSRRRPRAGLKRVKILQYLDSVGRGGAETLVLDLCQHWTDTGVHEIAFLTSGGGDLMREFAEGGFSYFVHERRRAVDLALIKRIRHLVVSQDIDIVHTHRPVEALHVVLALLGVRR